MWTVDIFYLRQIKIGLNLYICLNHEVIYSYSGSGKNIWISWLRWRYIIEVLLNKYNVCTDIYGSSIGIAYTANYNALKSHTGSCYLVAQNIPFTYQMIQIYLKKNIYVKICFYLQYKKIYVYYIVHEHDILF